LLDKNDNSQFSLSQDLEYVTGSAPEKLCWRMMCLSLPQIIILLGFFTKHI